MLLRLFAAPNLSYFTVVLAIALSFTPIAGSYYRISIALLCFTVNIRLFMGRRRKERVPTWTREDFAGVLAHLDRFVKETAIVTLGGLSAKEVDARIDSVLVYLEGKIDRKYSAQQIKQKIIAACEEGDPVNAEWNLPSVFIKGSSQIPGLDQHTRDLIGTNLLVFNYMTEDRQTRASSRHVETPAKTNQGFTTYDSTPHTRKRNIRSTSSATPVRVTKLRAGTVGQHSSKAKRVTGSHSLLGSPISYRRTRSRSAKPETPIPQSPSICDLTDSVPNTPRAQRIEVRIRKGYDRYQENVQETDIVDRKRSRQWESRFDEDHQELLAGFFALRKELDLAKDENRTLRREQAESNASMLRTKGDLNEFMQELKRKQRRINDLKAQQDEHAFLKPFLNLNTAQLRDMDLPLVQQKHASMRRQLVEIGLISDLGVFPRGKRRAQLFANSQDLRALQRKLSSLDAPEVETESIADISAQHLVQSLVAVAVRDWVFYEKFTSTATMEVPLLDAYRHHLSNLCNPEIMRSLDFAAHRRVFDQESFKEAISTKMASRLERRLVATLKPILDLRKECYEATEESDETLLKQKLTSIFCDALELKFLAMVSKDMFECIWPTLGTPFDANTMETERTRFSIDDDEDVQSKKLRLVLVPGLRLYEYDRQLVDYYGFKREHEKCTGNYRTIQRAVVLV